MIRATNLLRRAWRLMGRSPFIVAARAPAPASGDQIEDYTLHTYSWDDAAPAASDGEVSLGEIPLHMNATTRSPR